jgi:hypothetical protein
MDKILYCAGSFSTYNARFIYTQEKDEVMFQKNKDVVELSARYNIPLTIKVHPSGEKDNIAHFKYLTRNYPNVKVKGGYWKWFQSAERMIPKYQLIIIDIIRTALLPVMARSHIPCVLYTKRMDLLKKWGLTDLENILHICSTRPQLNSLLKKFSFGELYPPERQQLLEAWFKKRETIQRWYKVGLKSMILRRKFRQEWKNDGTRYITIDKLYKRIRRTIVPPNHNPN